MYSYRVGGRDGKVFCLTDLNIVCLISVGAFMCSAPIKIKCQPLKGRAVIFFWDISARWQGILF